MITELQINAVIQKLQDSAELHTQEIDDLINANALYLDYVDKENEVLFIEEKDYLEAILYVILDVSKLTVTDLNRIQELEEKNWEIMQSSKTLNDAFDSYFDGYKEEDLLAYIEDSISVPEDEEGFDFLTQVGKEYMVVKAKSLIDYSQLL